MSFIPDAKEQQRAPAVPAARLHATQERRARVSAAARPGHVGAGGWERGWARAHSTSGGVAWQSERRRRRRSGGSLRSVQQRRGPRGPLGGPMYGMVSSQSGGKGRSLRRHQLSRQRTTHSLNAAVGGSPRAGPSCSTADQPASPARSSSHRGQHNVYGRLVGFLKHTWTGFTMAVGKHPPHPSQDAWRPRFSHAGPRGGVQKAL